MRPRSLRERDRDRVKEIYKTDFSSNDFYQQDANNQTNIYFFLVPNKSEKISSQPRCSFAGLLYDQASNIESLANIRHRGQLED